jgi:hypothetical protein
MNFSIILDVPRWRIQPKQENQVYNSIVQGMQMEMLTSFSLKASGFLFATINQTMLS